MAQLEHIEANLPERGGKTRSLTKEDFSQKSAIFLQPKADFVMANPPFNVDEIDADKVKSDPRLPKLMNGEVAV